ncbi:MAG: IclR family transcriptional regulator [Acidobacteria bacterium]|nr:IclR family transcriptional regulator [Acidobacteriota bacterium]
MEDTKPAVVETADERYMVPVVRSTFRILEELSRSGGLGLNEICARTGVSKSTVFRVLTTLHSMGYVLRDPNRRSYLVSPSLADLVPEGAGIEQIRNIALPHMIMLRDSFGETVNLGHLQIDKIVYVEVVPSEYALRLSERQGATCPLHATALGKAILAVSRPELVKSLLARCTFEPFTEHTITDRDEFALELDRVRKRGYALDEEENMLMATCVAAPIVDPNGVPVAAISISGPSSRFHPKRDRKAVEALVGAVRAIAQELVRPGHLEPPAA